LQCKGDSTDDTPLLAASTRRIRPVVIFFGIDFIDQYNVRFRRILCIWSLLDRCPQPRKRSGRSIALVAVFFLMEAQCVAVEWKTSLNVGALVTLVAAVHYFYMREFWVQLHSSPILYRYIDWSITVPLQMIEFYLILSAVKAVSSGMFFRLLLGTVAMLAFGYMGEAQFMPPFGGFVLGLAGWAFILFEIFAGEAGKVAAGGEVNKYVQESFSTMRYIVTLGWSIYPLGYFFGYLMGAVNDDVLNLVYNLADFVNKIAFCLAIWQSAKNSTQEGGSAH